MKLEGGLFREGGARGFGALVLAVAAAGIIAASSWSDDELASRLAISGVVWFAIALAFGSARLVGIASLPVLGSALAASATADNPAWIQSIVIGCLWYTAVELAWDSIERRDGGRRSTALDFRRTYEVSAIVVISLAVTVTAYLASALDAPRTLVRQAFIIVAVVAALGFTIRHVVATAPTAPGDHS